VAKYCNVIIRSYILSTIRKLELRSSDNFYYKICVNISPVIVFTDVCSFIMSRGILYKMYVVLLCQGVYYMKCM